MAEPGYQLQKLTECCICFKTFSDPRMLPCIHTFCLECLKQTSKAARKTTGKNMPCPLCRKVFPIPAKGLNGLQKNFFMEHLIEVTTNFQLSNISSISCDICKHLYKGQVKKIQATMHCLECRDKFCDFCAKAHTFHKSSKGHHIVKIGSETEEDMRRISLNRSCNDHNGKPLDYYCPQCKKIVCISCVLENHASHECKDVSTVDDEFRQTIDRIGTKISAQADEISAKGKDVQHRKKNVVLKLKEIESEIREKHLELKKLIDNHTKSLMEELSLIKTKQLKDSENEKDEIDRIHAIFRSFETYCAEVRSKGSSFDICSCLDQLMTREYELEKDHETFIGRPYRATKISFKPADYEKVFNSSSSNVVGQIQETSTQFCNCVIIAGLNDGWTLTDDVFSINLNSQNEVLSHQKIPTTIQNGTAAAVHCSTMYVTGIGDNCGEIWKYDSTSGWMKRSGLVQGRSRHSAAFIDEVLYICGGYVDLDGSVLDSVEAYNAFTNKCTIAGKLLHCVKSSGNCVPFKTCLYIFGGTDKENNAMNRVQIYDTRYNTCTLLSKQMPRSYNLMQPVLWETSVILLGRYTCLIFNFETETWQEREQFKTDVVHFGLALENGRIFVIGGGDSATDETGKRKWICRDDVRYVPLRSIIEDKSIGWKDYAKLARPALIPAYGKISLHGRGRKRSTWMANLD